MFTLKQEVTHDGRPAIITAYPVVGADGSTVYGIRYTDMEAWISIEGFDIKRPNPGANKLARETDLSGRCAEQTEATMNQSTPHRHLFTTNAGRTARKCSRCGCEQVKISGKWKTAEPRPELSRGALRNDAAGL